LSFIWIDDYFLTYFQNWLWDDTEWLQLTSLLSSATPFPNETWRGCCRAVDKDVGHQYRASIYLMGSSFYESTTLVHWSWSSSSAMRFSSFFWSSYNGSRSCSHVTLNSWRYVAVSYSICMMINFFSMLKILGIRHKLLSMGSCTRLENVCPLTRSHITTGVSDHFCAYCIKSRTRGSGTYTKIDTQIRRTCGDKQSDEEERILATVRILQKPIYRRYLSTDHNTGDW
jgi:hypothetical protein